MWPINLNQNFSILLFSKHICAQFWQSLWVSFISNYSAISQSKMIIKVTKYLAFLFDNGYMEIILQPMSGIIIIKLIKKFSFLFFTQLSLQIYILDM